MEWIKCSDRMPEDEQRVLIYIRTIDDDIEDEEEFEEEERRGVIFEASFDYNTFKWWRATHHDGSIYENHMPTHWMPLPPEPK